MTRFYGFSWGKQLKMQYKRWLHYVEQMATLQREEIATLTMVLDPLVNAALVSPFDKRRGKMIKAIQRAVKALKKVDYPWKTQEPAEKLQPDGKLREETSRRLDREIGILAGQDFGLKGKIVSKKKES